MSVPSVPGFPRQCPASPMVPEISIPNTLQRHNDQLNQLASDLNGLDYSQIIMNDIVTPINPYTLYDRVVIQVQHQVPYPNSDTARLCDLIFFQKTEEQVKFEQWALAEIPASDPKTAWPAGAIIRDPYHAFMWWQHILSQENCLIKAVQRIQRFALSQLNYHSCVIYDHAQLHKIAPKALTTTGEKYHIIALFHKHADLPALAPHSIGYVDCQGTRFCSSLISKSNGLLNEVPVTVYSPGDSIGV